MRHSRRLAVALVAAGMVLVATPLAVWAQADRFTGFYNLVASSSGVSLVFGDPASQPYPVAGGTVPQTTASLANGPTAYALSSAAWPGPLLANAGSLAGLLLPLCVAEADVCSPRPDSETTALANYPVRAEAFSPGGQNTDEMGPMSARAVADDADARAGVADFVSSGIVSTGRVTTRSHSFLEIGRGTSRAEVVLKEVELAAGAVKIQSLRTVALASTDGQRTTTRREIVVEGLEIGGQAATIDEEGVRFTDQASDPVNEEILANFGIELFLTKPLREQRSGGEARLHTGALAARWTLGDSGNEVLLTLGGAAVHVQGAGALGLAPTGEDSEFGPFTAAPAPAPPGAGPVAAAPPTPSVAAAPGTEVTGPGEVALPDLRPATFFRGIAPGWFVVGLIGAFVAGLGLRRLRGLALTPAAGLTNQCPLQMEVQR